MKTSIPTIVEIAKIDGKRTSVKISFDAPFFVSKVKPTFQKADLDFKITEDYYCGHTELLNDNRTENTTYCLNAFKNEETETAAN